MVRYRCTPPEVEYYVVMSCGVSYVVICALVLLLLLTRKSNLFRLACLLTVCSEFITILSAMVSCSTSHQSPLEKHALQMAVMLVKWTAAVLFDVALLRHGRSYRPAGLRNTRLFIITVMVIIVASLLMVPFLVFYRMSSTAAKYATVYSVIQYLVTSTRYLAFLLSILYAFFPMFSIHGVGNSQSPHYSIDARTAAFGTYYMIIAFLWFIFIVSFDVVTTSKVSVMKRYAHVAFFISAFMNSTASLALGLQAPYSFVERLRRTILGRTINRVVIVERGVLSTGILEGKVYESPL